MVLVLTYHFQSIFSLFQANATELTTPAPPSRNIPLAWAEVSVQILIFVVALLSNLLVLVALVRQLRRKPSSRMYRLMYHLSVADLLVAVFSVLPQIIWDITFRWAKKSI